MTAGHDGQFNSSFSMIADKRLRPIMDLLEINLITNNFAQSANGCIPYGWCYETMGLSDPDWVNWEQVIYCYLLFIILILILILLLLLKYIVL